MFSWCRISHHFISSAHECDFVFFPQFHTEEIEQVRNRRRACCCVGSAAVNRSGRSSTSMSHVPSVWWAGFITQLPATTCSCTQDYKTMPCSVTRYKYYRPIIKQQLKSYSYFSEVITQISILRDLWGFSVFWGRRMLYRLKNLSRQSCDFELYKNNWLNLTLVNIGSTWRQLFGDQQQHNM